MINTRPPALIKNGVLQRYDVTCPNANKACPFTELLVYIQALYNLKADEDIPQEVWCYDE